MRLMDLDADRGSGPATGEGRHRSVATDHPAPGRLPGRHAAARGAVLPTDRLLCFRSGAALTSRRYDHLWHRIGQRLPWAAAHGVSTHWCGADVDGAAFRLRHRPRLRRSHRYHRTGDDDLHQGRPASRGHRLGRHDRPTPPTCPARRASGPPVPRHPAMNNSKGIRSQSLRDGGHRSPNGPACPRPCSRSGDSRPPGYPGRLSPDPVVSAHAHS